MAIDKLNSMIESDEFQSAPRNLQQQALRGFFKMNVSTTDEFKNATKQEQNQAYRGYLNTYLPKSMVEKVVEKVDTFAKDPIGNIIGKRDNSQNFPAKKPQPQPQQTTQATTEEPKPKGTTPWDNLMEAKKIDTRFVTSDPAKVKAAIDADKKKKEDAHNKLNQQLGDAPLEDRTLDVAFVGGGAVHGIKGAAEMVAGKVLKNKEMIEQGAKATTAGGAFAVGDAAGQVGAVAAMEGVDAAIDEEWKKENPTLAAGLQMGAGLIVGGVAGYKAEMRALTTGQQQIFDAADDIIKSSSESMGIENPKNVNRDEAIAKALNEEYGVSANPATEVVQGNAPKTPSTQASDGKDLQGESVLQNADEVKADADFVTDINVGRKADEITPIVEDEADTLKAKMQAEQDERLRVANEEMLARKAEYEAQLKAKEEADAAYASDVEFIQNHPRVSELIESRRNVTAKQAEKPNIRESDRQIIHENNGDGYETSVIPAHDVKNYAHDFALTKSDIAQYEKNGMSPELAEKFKKDLDVLDNNPVYAIGDTPTTTQAEGDQISDAITSESRRILNGDSRNTESLLQSTGEVKPRSDEPLDDFGNPIFAKGGDNLLVGAWAGIDEDENGNITFDPAKFIMGLGGYTALKAFVKNPTVQREAKEYAIRALNELDKKSYARYLTGEMNIVENAPVKNADTAKGGFYSAAERAIEKMPNKMDAAAFVKYLKNNGVKDDEITWSGIAKAIEGKETITKAEIKEAFGNPEMGKVVNLSSGDVAQMQADSNRLFELHERNYNAIGENNPYKKPHDEYDPDELTKFETYVKEKYGVDTVAELDDLIKKQSGVKYQSYALKGIGENYREELVTLPTTQEANKARIIAIEAQQAKMEPIIEKMRAEYNEKPFDLFAAQRGEFTAKEKELFDMEARYQKLNEEKDTLLSNRHFDRSADYKSSHWDEPNVLLHTRKQDTLIDGERTLLVEEIQSDWHQAGRKGGYKDGSEEEMLRNKNAEVDALDAQYYARIESEGLEKSSYEASQIWKKEFQPKLAEIRNKYAEQTQRLENGVPQAPYAKTWQEFGMRQVIDEAVMSGYERVAWVTGKTSADRYSLSKSVDRLVYNKDANIIQGFKDGEEVMYKTATENDLESLIGKDPAKKLLDSEVKPNIYEIKGEALDIGGDGMKGFYDKILVDFTRKYTKKWGVEVETKQLVDGTEVHSFPVNAKMKEDVSKNGQALYAQGGGVLAGVGEDENGNMTFDPMMALAGIAGTSMIMSKTVRNNLSKLIGKTEHLSDSAIQGMVRVAIKSADKITGNSLKDYATKIGKKELFGVTVENIVDYVVGHKIYKMKDYMKLREDALRSANAGMEQAAKLHLQLKELSSEAREAMYGYMSGDKNVVLTPELKAAADTFITKIDDMGQQLVDEGILTKEAYEEWKGQYLHRKYASKMKKASDWASGKGEFRVESIKMRGKTWEATADEYQALEDAGMIGKVSEGKVEVIHEVDGTYKLRRDWTKEERTAMGEIRDIAYSLPETVGRMAQMLHYSTMLKSIPKKYILAQDGRADAVMKGLGYEKLTGSRYGALNGKWVNQSIAGDLKRVANDVMGEEANVKKLWNDYVTAVKMSHTVYNPTAHVNNVGSNVFLQAAAGLNPLKTIKYATDGTMAARKYTRMKELDALRVKGLNAEDAAELSKLEGDADVALWKDLDENRMFGRSQLNEMLRTYMSPHVDVTGGAVNAIRKNAEALYQGEDDVMRFAAVKQLMDDGLWIDGAVSRMDLKAAMKHVNDHIVPDYSKPMSKLALTLRDSGVVPFMSWMYYSTPILISQLKNHPTRVLGIGAAWYAMDKMFGVDPFETDGAPKGFAQQRVAVGRDGDKVTGMRVSSMIPHIQLANPANTFLEPLTSGIPQTLLGSATNYNFYFRKPITQKDGAEGTYHRVKDAAMNVLPSPDVIDKAYNLAESKLLSKETRRRDRVFEPRTPAQEAASFFVNLQTYDEGNHKASVRKERIKENKQSSQWERKMDRAMDKLFGGGN